MRNVIQLLDHDRSFTTSNEETFLQKVSTNSEANENLSLYYTHVIFNSSTTHYGVIRNERVNITRTSYI